MLTALAALTLLAVYAACLGWMLSARRRAPALTGALAAALLICVEALLLQALSIFQAVGRWELVAVNGGFVLISAPLLLRRKIRWPRVPRLRGDSGPWIWLGALGLLAFISAAVYVPSNWDSMTYHLARVAYWYENHSVRPYPTNISRQVAYPPGAEYLILVLQVISGTDRLAAFVQCGAWILMVIAAPPLARTFGAPVRLSRWAALLVGAAPMAIVQASSTQNDLVATVTVIAIVVACVPFLHRRSRWRASDLVLLIVALAAALLVKPTSVIVTLPFLCWGVAASVRSLFSPGVWQRVLPASPAAVVAAGIVAPVLSGLAALRGRSELGTVVTNWLYVGFGEPKERLLNLLRGVLRNLPSPLLDKLVPGHPTGCSVPGSLCLAANRLFTEDTIANPGQIAFVLVAVPLGIAGMRALPSRTRLGLIAWTAAWLAFHVTFRDNVWIPRLQLPLFGLLPILFAVIRPEWIRGGPILAAAGALLVGVAACGAIAVVMDAGRPIEPQKLSEGSIDEAYYNMALPKTFETHNEALRWLDRAGCKRLGLFIGEDSYDYPLTWRAMRAGVEVHHVVGVDNWPCAVFTDRGPPPPRSDGLPWVRSQDRSLYLTPRGRMRSERDRDL